MCNNGKWHNDAWTIDINIGTENNNNGCPKDYTEASDNPETVNMDSYRSLRKIP